ncbi:kelch repeat-containing protein [Corallococcus sp. CA047B]|uniref:kelch repeat-containing protein n=1 Tax=Corallococcus sp. CA047B TaxID=2316729 RepID=UPI001315ADF1|nr:kelch repeat-containing protein [Corallococcus sp. CA047B]
MDGGRQGRAVALNTIPSGIGLADAGPTGVLDMRRPVAVGLCLLLGLTACDSAAPPAREGAGVTSESRLGGNPGEVAARSAAVGAWREAPSEARARALAHAYFPEWTPTAGGDDSLPKGVDAALSVRVPGTATGTLEVSTRGMTFRVRRHAAQGQGAQAKVLGDARHFWAPVGARTLDGAGRWVTSRVEEYDVAPEGAAEHRVRYTVEVPEGIVAVRDLGEYLEFVDAHDVPRLRMHSLVARDAEGLSRDGEVRLHGAVRAPGTGPARYGLSGRSLDVAMVVDLRGMQGPVVVDPGWSSTGSMALAHRYHTATLLPSGKVLVAGGLVPTAGYTRVAELFDPLTGTWKGVAPMAEARAQHTATLLGSGRLLIVGGTRSGSVLSTAELFDPETETWSPADVLTTARVLHTATLLRDGRVLVTGGQGLASEPLVSSEVFEPATGSWSPAGAMSAARVEATATLLPSGKVLVAGGIISTAVTELFDPATRQWTETGAMVSSRQAHSATLLPDGKVLVAGGTSSGGYSQSIATTELYDPITGRWKATGGMAVAHKWHSASLLPDGTVLVTGGASGASGGWALGTAVAELYLPSTGTWQSAGTLQTARGNHTATLLPSGRVLIAGGYVLTTNTAEANYVNSPEVVEFSGRWTPEVPANTPRVDHTTTLLPTGQILVTGGRNTTGTLATAELHDRAGGHGPGTSFMLLPRARHTATLLASGRVLVTGGTDGNAPVAEAELYDPAPGQWLPAGRMSVERVGHTATLLPSGRVLVTGGSSFYGVQSSVEVFDPRSMMWIAATPMASPRVSHVATLLPSGKVLVTGGNNGNTPLNTAQVYDPNTDTWGALLTMTSTREEHTATVLSSGKVLLVGGLTTGGMATSEVEQYDPVVNTWARLTRLGVPRAGHTATLLASGDVVITGGQSGADSYYNSVERFEASTANWAYLAPMVAARTGHTATLMPTGEVLVFGGRSSTVQAAVESFDPVSALASARPTLDTPRILSPGASFIATGTRLRGVSDGGSGGYHSSSSEAPLVRLVNVESGAVSWVKNVTAWQDGKQFSARAPTVAAGQYLLLVTVQGITGGRMVRVTEDNAVPIALNTTVSTPKNTPVAVTLSGTDADSDSLAYSIAQNPQHGTVSGAGAFLVYTPATGYSGLDTFSFRVNDGVADSSAGTVTLRVNNAIPVALAVSVTTSKAKPVQVTLAGLDGDQDPLTFRLITQPLRGTLSGSAPHLTYTPNAGYVGTDSFTYRASDGSTESWPVPVTLSTVNLAPVARSATLTTVVGQGVPFTLEATDADGDALTYAVVQAPQHGTLSGTAPHLIYTPQWGYEGPDTFSFRANDGTTNSNLATVTTTVAAQVPHAPSVPVLRTPGDNTVLGTGDVTFTWDASTDPEGDALTYRLELSRDGAVLASLNAAGTSLTLPGSLSPGTYTWRVEAVDSQGHRGGFSAPASFTVSPMALWRTSGGQGLQEDDASGGLACSSGGSSGWAPWLGTLVLLALSFRRRLAR